MVEIKNLLDDAIVEAIQNLENLEPGSAERASAVAELDKLYRLKIEETKVDKEYEEKWHNRVENQVVFEEDVKSRKIDHVLRIVGIATPLIFSAVQMHKVFKFEETGTITSAASRWTLNGLPKLWK